MGDYHGGNQKADAKLSITEYKPYMNIPSMDTYILPAEWHRQAMIQLTWPHAQTDWAYMLEEVYECFIRLAKEISQRQPLWIVTPHPEEVREQLKNRTNMDNITFLECPTNDTWARDHAFLTTLDGNGNKRYLDFCFNGWGMKFAANLDNQINQKIFASGFLKGEYIDCLNFVLEGGSIESDGKNSLLTTAPCLLAPNRNARHTTKEELETALKQYFGLSRILWLDYGYLAGDDTDSHVDTLARLCSEDTIAYVQCSDPNDEHYHELQQMEEQLKNFKTAKGLPYQLIPLPMPKAIFEEEERLPATYANFLIMNEAVLYPTYNQPENDALAKAQLQKAFPTREIVGIDCCALIRQHGSLHCVTMQYPE